MNRAIARRTMIERRADARTFLAAVAGCVRRGWLEVHAYSLLHTHYHMLVRSPQARLADSMHRVQLTYSRAFNRGRRRDGPLVRGRYRSKRVGSLRYRRVLVAYIDFNPVQARLARHPAEYTYGSAWYYGRRSGPPWLERSWVESEIRATSGREYAPSDYDAAFGPRVPAALRRVVGERIESGSLEDPLDDLLGVPAERVVDWMRRKAALADGTRPGLSVSDLATVERAVAACHMAARRAAETIGEPLWNAMRAGLAHALTGSTQARIAARLGCSSTWAGQLIRRHGRQLELDPGYAAWAARVTQEVVGRWEGW